MTSITLQNCSPFLKAFNKEPTFSHLKVFGCACYPLLRLYTVTTLFFFFFFFFFFLKMNKSKNVSTQWRLVLYYEAKEALQK
jgi:hypothetical protein